MNTLTMGKAHTLDPDYEAFSGRVVQTFTTTYYDPKAKAWIRRTVEYIDVGRQDRVTPVDSEAELTPDPWEPNTKVENARRANRQRSDDYHTRIQLDVMGYLRQHGPSHCQMIARDLELPYTTVNEHMRRFANRMYTKVGRQGIAVIWGLVGVHDKEAA